MERLCLFLYFGLQLIPLSFGHPLCSSHDSLALLHFKQSLTMTDNPEYSFCNYSLPLKTMSWNGSVDCCTWDGVTCDNFTGRVIDLNLNCSKLEGTIHPNTSLFQLQTLDLSLNNFSGSTAIEPLSWNLRLRIAIGAARGLAFLHSSDHLQRFQGLQHTA